MIKSNINDVLIKKMFSTEEKLVMQALEDVKQNGNSQYIPSLIELLYLQNSEEIETAIVELLSEIKAKDAPEEFVKALQNQRYSALKEVLLGCCWQNGLDFSPYLNVIADFFLDEDYMVAFEAYTVIQNTEEKISAEDAMAITQKLKNAIPLVSDDRKTLITDVLDYLPTITQ